MKQLKRSECAILPLVLKGKWYDMIASGEKKEEYRDYNSYWANRLHRFFCRARGKMHIVSFSRRYKKAGMFFEIVSVSKTFCTIVGGHPEWGEPKEQHYKICLGQRVELID